eukprot:gb/GECG01005153.1/.p1 GENE.gb/GECG01005153.1/~~gb/GECG01005153.1/.p1  ORF type:complete len:541 (+),score=72.68 gb/GECG01005153.1/:1-1623(+)
MAGNSTINTSRLMEVFVKILYPDIEVVQLASPDSIFRFDQNVRFMRSQLQPIINEERRLLAQKFDDTWKQRFHLTLALADGAPARVAALNAALRQYRPNYLHLFELKNLWFNGLVTTADIDFFPFETAQVSPPVDMESLSGLLRQLATEMLDHYRKFTSIRDGHLGDAGHDLATFWLRKSRKPVLAVLAVQKEGDECPTFYRGMNMEVSMPTGSLCAERNAIGSALVSDPSLKRRDIKAVAVLSVTLLPTQSWKPIKQVMNERKSATEREQNSSGNTEKRKTTDSTAITPEAKAAFYVMDRTHGKNYNQDENFTLEATRGESSSVTPPRAEPYNKVASEKVFRSPASKRNLPTETPASLDLSNDERESSSSNGEGLEERQSSDQSISSTQSVLMRQESVQQHSTGNSLAEIVTSTKPDGSPRSQSDFIPSPIKLDGENRSGSLSDISQAAGVVRPLQRGEHDCFSRRKKITPVFPKVTEKQIREEGLGEGVDGSDIVLNPISPCGSCIEWLKKVDEVNPDLAVVTFTDTSCKKLYIRNVV